MKTLRLYRKILYGNVVLCCLSADDNEKLYDYFTRKHWYAITNFNTMQCDRFAKSHTINIAIFGREGSAEERLIFAKKIHELDSQTIILFYYDSEQEQQSILASCEKYLTYPLPINTHGLVKKILDSNKQIGPIDDQYQLGIYTYYPCKSLLVVKKGDSELMQSLTRKENGILSLLASNINKTVPRHRLLQNLWKTEDSMASRSLDVYLTRIRKYLCLDNSLSIVCYRPNGIALEIKQKEKTE